MPAAAVIDAVRAGAPEDCLARQNIANSVQAIFMGDAVAEGLTAVGIERQPLRQILWNQVLQASRRLAFVDPIEVKGNRLPSRCHAPLRPRGSVAQPGDIAEEPFIGLPRFIEETDKLQARHIRAGSIRGRKPGV